MNSLQSAVLQRTAAQRGGWRAEITIDGVLDTEFIYSPVYGLPGPARSCRVDGGYACSCVARRDWG